MIRRHFLLGSASAVVAGAAFGQTAPVMRVAKTPTCGCCAAWVSTVVDAGLSVDVEDVDQEVLWAMKDGLGITSDLSGCHTALIGDYFIEGHVPAREILRLIAETPDARGLTVPGMPMGSPGMGAAGTGDAYEVLLVMNDGTTQVFASYA